MAHAIVPDEVDPRVKLQRQMDEAWLRDLEIIRKLSEEEKQAEEDRKFAMQLAGVELVNVPDEQRQLAMLLEDFDDDQLEPADSDFLNQTTLDQPSDPETHQVSCVKPAHRPEKKNKCAICLETVNTGDPRVPCGHYYHTVCLKELCISSMTDESLMPPRCCQTLIPIALAKLNVEENQAFLEKKLEYSTKNRLYCHRQTCSKFIPPVNIVNDIGKCPDFYCGASTCFICKGASHGNEDCPKDSDTLAVLQAAKDAGWSRCPNCGAVIELAFGCFHMTCRCRSEFCYVCTKPWKICTCPQWEEQNLFQEAEVRVNRLIAARDLPGNNFQEQVARMAAGLRNNAECRHDRRWVYVSGAGRCEECHHFLSLYLFRCSRCQLMACNRCRHNRF